MGAFRRRSLRDVDDGRLCPAGWSAEAGGLFTDTLKAYDGATRGYWRDAQRAAPRARPAGYLASGNDAAPRDQLAGAR